MESKTRKDILEEVIFNKSKRNDLIKRNCKVLKKVSFQNMEKHAGLSMSVFCDNSTIERNSYSQTENVNKF